MIVPIFVVVIDRLMIVKYRFGLISIKCWRLGVGVIENTVEFEI